MAPPVFETRLANGLWMHIAAANGSGRAEFNLAPASDSACLQQPGKLEGKSFWKNYESKSLKNHEIKLWHRYPLQLGLFEEALGPLLFSNLI